MFATQQTVECMNQQTCKIWSQNVPNGLVEGADREKSSKTVRGLPPASSHVGNVYLIATV